MSLSEKHELSQKVGRFIALHGINRSETRRSIWGKDKGF